MRDRSCARKLKGTVKEILGTCVSVGCTVDHEDPREVQSKVSFVALLTADFGLCVQPAVLCLVCGQLHSMFCGEGAHCIALGALWLQYWWSVCLVQHLTQVMLVFGLKSPCISWMLCWYAHDLQSAVFDVMPYTFRLLSTRQLQHHTHAISCSRHLNAAFQDRQSSE